MPGELGYMIALPFYVKPLADMPSKHRKRAAQRRERWRAICEAARATLESHLLHPPIHAGMGLSGAEPDMAPGLADAAAGVAATTELSDTANGAAATH